MSEMGDGQNRTKPGKKTEGKRLKTLFKGKTLPTITSEGHNVACHL